jgi:hypothetical protein
MPKCSVCQSELTGGLDTYGGIQEPLCQDCFLSGESTADHAYRVLVKKQEDLKKELGDVEDEIDALHIRAYELRSELIKTEAVIRKKTGQPGLLPVKA